MAQRVSIGSWSRLFGGRRSFALEADRAQAVDPEWLSTPFQRDIVFPKLPGWLAPLWGSDHEWLYLRRPEGVWRARIPKDFCADTPITIHERSLLNGSETIRGGMGIGRSLTGHSGWIRGSAVDEPIEAADLDGRSRPSSRGFEVDADIVGRPLGEVAAESAERLELRAGDYFARPPAFALDGRWLVATDVQSGLRVAYDIGLPGYEFVGEALDAERLWLRFEGRWLASFAVQVAF